MRGTRLEVPHLTLELCGPARLLLPGGQARPLDALGALLVARLALQGPQARAELAPLLWPDVDEARARANLRQRLLRLKSLAGHAWIAGDIDLQLTEDVRVSMEGDGELLAGVDTAAVAEELHAWLRGARIERLRRSRELLQQQADAAEAAGNLEAARSAADRLLALEPHSEVAHRRLVRLLYLQGDSGAAARASEACEAMLRREFDAVPSAESRSLFALVARADAAPLPAPGPRALPTALLRPPRMVGRAAEHLALREAVGSGRPALVTGEAGMGKSRLLAELVTGMPASQVRRVKAQPGDGGVPYATLVRLLHGAEASRRSAASAWWTVQAPQVQDASAAMRRQQLQQTAAALVEGLAVTLVVVDDLHFADAASLEMVQALACSGGRPGWVFAQRPGEGLEACAALTNALDDGGGLCRIHLALLGEAQMAELLADVGLPVPEAARLAGPLTRHCGGNPLFALETLKQMPAVAKGDLALPQPTTVTALIDRRLRQLSPLALSLARAAAVAGPDFGPALAAAVLARPAIDLADAWAELESAQVLRGGTFAHDLVFDAAARSIPAPIATHLHAAVAAWLEARDGEPARVAFHWQQAADPVRARPWLAKAGEQAEEGLRMAEAATFFEQAAAIDAGTPQSDRHALLLRAAQARQTAEGGDAALPVYRAALAAAGTAAEHVATAAALRTLLDESGRFEEGRRVGLEAMSRAESAGDERLVAQVLLGTIGAMVALGENAEAEALIDRHWNLWRRIEPNNPIPPGTRAIVLDGLGRTREAQVFHELAAELVANDPVLANHLTFLGNHALNRMDAGDLGAAEALLARSAAIEAGYETLVSGGLARHRAVAARDRAKVRLALQAFGEAESQEQRNGSPLLLAMVRLHRAALWCQLGQWARALQDLPPTGGNGELPPWMELRTRQLRMRIARGSGATAASTSWPGVEELMSMGNPPLGMSIRLDLALQRAEAGAGAAAESCDECAAIEADAGTRGMCGATWAARLHGACVALRAGDRARAQAWALACMQRDEAITPLDLWDGPWWHALWRVWQGLGDTPRAQAAHAEGLAWVHRMLQRELEPAFHAGFRQVTACRQLLLGPPA